MSKITSASVLIDFDDGQREVFELAGGRIELIVLEKTDERPTMIILIVATDSEDDALDFVRLKKDDARWTQDARRARHEGKTVTGADCPCGFTGWVARVCSAPRCYKCNPRPHPDDGQEQVCMSQTKLVCKRCGRLRET